MSRQQMSFQLEYGASVQGKPKCKSCQGLVEEGDFMVGVKSESMYDPMWYHFHCFWTRCWYRKQISRHLEDYTELAGFSKLTPEDKQKFKDALDVFMGGTEDTNPGLKKRSMSADNLLDENCKKMKPEVALPKLTLSAAGFLSRSSANLAADHEEEIAVSENLVATIRKSSNEILLTIAMTDIVNNSKRTFQMNQQQWQMLTQIFDEVSLAMKQEQGKEFPLRDCQFVRVSSDVDKGIRVTLGTCIEAAANTEDNPTALTFSPEQWIVLTTRADDIRAAISRLSG